MLVIPLRTSERYDIAGPVASFIDKTYKQPTHVPNGTKPSAEFHADLIRISFMRHTLSKSIYTNSGHVNAITENALKAASDYYSIISDCDENRDMGQLVLPECMGVNCAWSLSPAKSSFTMGERVLSPQTLRRERVGVLWNIGALESHCASLEIKDDGSTTNANYTKAMKKYKEVAGIFQFLEKVLLCPEKNKGDSVELAEESKIVSLAQSLMLAQGQTCVFAMARNKARPMHRVLAQLAISVADLYSESLKYTPEKLNPGWKRYIETQCIKYQALAEYHESLSLKATAEKSSTGYGNELTRLTLCLNHLERALITIGLDDTNDQGKDDVYLRNELVDLKNLVSQKKDAAEKENSEVYHDDVPLAREMKAIKGKLLVAPDKFSKNPMHSSLPKPLFSGMLPSDALDIHRTFVDDLKNKIGMWVNNVKRESDDARKTLARVNLPQSLQSDGSNGVKGFPPSLWAKVEKMQNDRVMEKLNHDLWDLKDISEMARNECLKASETLDCDVMMDLEFRTRFPEFRGRIAKQTQVPLRRNLQHYTGILNNARNGDAVILKMLEAFEMEPRFKMLSMTKTKLDKLIPSVKHQGESISNVDTSMLTKLLAEIAEMINEREIIIEQLRVMESSCDFKQKLSAAYNASNSGSSNDFSDLIRQQMSPFDFVMEKVKCNIQKQPELLDRILVANRDFVNERQTDEATSLREKCIKSIEEAIKKVKIVKDQLLEGRGFYDSIMPRLKQLKQQADEESVKLAIERVDYEDGAQDRERRCRQLRDDEMFARTMSSTAMNASSNNTGVLNIQHDLSNNFGNSISSSNDARRNDVPGSSPPLPTGPNQNLKSPPVIEGNGSRPPIASSNNSNYNNTIGSYNPPTYQPRQKTYAAGVPGVYSVSNHEKPPTRVDDEKVATLVGMDFNAERVVEALAKYDNNVEQALNELLSGH
mmetsp:Transcript_33088/g.38318  ORF Transcript_33088/g.38318 Transcript_33088/m.38318 type:complete len:935 (+) Transcript_33088:191-2995(+)|eukprot:CAMPEP_0194385456 /NCGR_PEP_ID=MMETSP0174-20130528/80433_1 /TAXON_ID=216777 /ORGANISM="Proboscia alata, Strain PI-D3" /LENGTH=934 /DNA_ID=CAMNT_0039173639 /DNA_START=155 /DNA_END=2959 /DNA_ORIENTATION=-